MGLNGMWGHVAGSGRKNDGITNIDYIEAAVACHDLGYHYGEILDIYSPISVTPVLWFSVSMCSGLERRLADCPRYTARWDHDDDIYIRCSMDVPYGITWDAYGRQIEKHYDVHDGDSQIFGFYDEYRS